MNAKLADLGFHSAETIARRMPMIWWNFWFPTVSTRAEMTKMVVEKQMAFAEGIFGMQVEAWRQVWALPAGASSTESMEKMIDAAITPAARRAKANALRLRRRKFR